MMQEPNELRRRLQSLYRADEKTCIRYLVERAELSTDSKNRIYNIAKQIIEKIKHNKLDIIDSFLQQYLLSNDEAIALLCLIESLLRIPDNYTIDELIKDKISNQEWNKYLWSSSSLFVNASTWSLMIGSNILKSDSKFSHIISKLLKNLGEPIVRKAIKQSVSMLGKHFIVGESIEQALDYVKLDNNLYSFDIFGETSEAYFNTYMHSIKAIGKENGEASDCFRSHGISIKLSALHPRYVFSQYDHIVDDLLSKMLEICREAKKYNISLCINAEEAEHLEMSLMLFEKLRLDESLSQWEGLGLAIQAYQKRALHALDFIEDIAIRSKHKIMVRLVKGAYWDSEIKCSQALGLSNYPVFTRKSYTDVSYLACTQKLLNQSNYFYPCFATHNAYTFATIIEIADKNHPGFEFQRLYGMSKNLYDYAMPELATSINCRIYAPVGKHRDLLPSLTKHLLENRSNSSFISQPVDELILDPLEQSKGFNYEPHPNIPLPQDIFGPDRKNALGIDISDSMTVIRFFDEVKNFTGKKWQVGPIIDGQLLFDNTRFYEAVNPANLTNIIGEVSNSTDEQALNALAIARDAFSKWQDTSVEERAKFLEKAADLFEERIKVLIYILVIESGKIISHAIAEVRQAVNCLRYYAVIAKSRLNNLEKLPGPIGENSFVSFMGIGVFLCMSPWDSPLAAFVKQVSAALVTGNVVLATPEKCVPIIACEAVKILHEVGIPTNVLNFILGDINKIYDKVDGIAFTGSEESARVINAKLVDKRIPLIAETNGLNAMVVDSSALMEHVTIDTLSSAFYKRGQNCSVLFIQDDVAEKQIKMICNASEWLRVGNPIDLSTDIGPMIDKISLDLLTQYTEKMSADTCSSLLSKLSVNMHGYFFPPYIYEVEKVSQLKQRIFGPILHIIRFDKSQLTEIISDINNIKCGAFSLYSHIQNRIDVISKMVSADHVCINCGIDNGVRASGLNYLQRFSKERVISLI